MSATHLRCNPWSLQSHGLNASTRPLPEYGGAKIVKVFLLGNKGPASVSLQGCLSPFVCANALPNASMFSRRT